MDGPYRTAAEMRGRTATRWTCTTCLAPQITDTAACEACGCAELLGVSVDLDNGVVRVAARVRTIETAGDFGDVIDVPSTDDCGDDGAE